MRSLRCEEVKFRGAVRVPGVFLEVRLYDFAHQALRETADASHVELKMHRRVWLKVFHAEPEEADGRMEPAAIFRVFRAEKLLLEMHKCTRNLDQPFEKQIVVVPALQPQVLQHVMRFVILAGIETGEISLVARIQGQLGICAELGYK
jgi:hypothetical protein